MPRTARMFSVWNSPKPTPEAAATTAPLTDAWGRRPVRACRSAGRPDRPAEVQVGHLRVLEHLAGRPGQHHAAGLHDDPVGRQPQAEADVLLDEQDRLAGVAHQDDVLEDLLERLRVEAERRLVEEHELRVEHQRARELDHPPLAAGEVARLLGRRARARPGTGPRPRRSGASRSARSRRTMYAPMSTFSRTRDVREDRVALRDLGDPRARGSRPRGARRSPARRTRSRPRAARAARSPRAGRSTCRRRSGRRCTRSSPRRPRGRARAGRRRRRSRR